MLLIIAVLSTSILSFTLGIAVTTLILYCYMRTRHHRKPPDSLTSKQLRIVQQAKHSENIRASEYQDIPVYQEVKEFKVPEGPPKSTKLDMDVSLMQNSAYGRICELEASTLEDKANENSESVIVNPIYS